MKVALLTMFNGLSPTYSLVNVVAEQLEMLLSHNIEVKLLVSEDCPLDTRYGIFLDQRIEWIPIVNHLDERRIIWHDYAVPTDHLHATFAKEASLISKDFALHLEDVDVCFLHDILYQGWHYIHNLALRLAIPNLPHTKFLAFTHSFPAKRPSLLTETTKARFIPLPNTYYVYPTYSGIPALARQYNVPEGICRVVYNSLSSLSFVSEEVRTLHTQVNLLESELLVIYPGRLTPSKKFEKVVALAGSLYTHAEKTIKVICCDFPSTDIPVDTYKNQIRTAALAYGLPKSSLIFTSDYGFPNGLPRQCILDLFTLSNLFICPSFSESFGLTVLEAASRGNLLILNENVPALAELGQKLHAYFMAWDGRGFGQDYLKQYHPSEASYYQLHTKKIIQKFYQDDVLFAKTQARLSYSPEWIWHHQLEPLLSSCVIS